MKKSLIAIVLSICLLFASCAAFAEEYVDIHMRGELGITVFANGGALMMGGSEVSLFAATREPGMTFGEMLGLENLLSIHKDDAVFAGWTVYVEDPEASVDTGGVLCFEMVENQPMSASTYTEYYWMVSTEELAEIVCEEENYIIVANWMSEDEYYMDGDEYAEGETVVMPSITLITEEGFSVASVEPDQTFGEALGLDTIDVVSEEGGEFTGWTVYEYNIDTAEYSETSVEEEGVLCFELFEDYYWVLREYTSCVDLLSTEELAAYVCDAPDHVVIANFQ